MEDCYYSAWLSLFFFFNDPAPTEIYTLSLHDALPISFRRARADEAHDAGPGDRRREGDRKSTRLNSSHPSTSYAVFCLKKKNHHTNMDLSSKDVGGKVELVHPRTKA